MKKNIPPLLPDTRYHIYNRGINKTNIFFEEKNYEFFLEKYSFYISPIAETYAYCLLKNHFHFLIKLKSENDIQMARFIKASRADSVSNAVSPGSLDKQISIEKYISLQFSHFFNSYSQAINRKYDRTGGLFETPFRIITVEDDNYFTQLISYIHLNPLKHGWVEDFKDYPYSSYKSHLSDKPTKLQRKQVLEWFGGLESHQSFHDKMGITTFLALEL